MDTKRGHVLIFALVLLAGVTLVALTWAAPGNAPQASGGAPTVVAYQGEVRVSGTPHTGNGYFKFAVVNAAGNTSYWSNDGTSTGGAPPTAAVQLAVSEGLFSVLLGDTTVGGMTQALAASVFGQPDRYLRVWFSTSASGTFSQLTPDTRIAAVPYALQAQEAGDADTVDGEHSSAFADATHNHAPGDISPQGAGSGLDADTVDGSQFVGTMFSSMVYFDAVYSFGRTIYTTVSGDNRGMAGEQDATTLSANVTCVAKNLAVWANSGNPSFPVTSVQVTLRVNGSDTSISCSIANPSAGGSTCNSGSATHTIAPGSSVSIKIVGYGSSIPPNASLSLVRFGFQCQ